MCSQIATFTAMHRLLLSQWLHIKQMTFLSPTHLASCFQLDDQSIYYKYYVDVFAQAINKYVLL